MRRESAPPKTHYARRAKQALMEWEAAPLAASPSWSHLVWRGKPLARSIPTLIMQE